MKFAYERLGLIEYLEQRSHEGVDGITFGVAWYMKEKVQEEEKSWFGWIMLGVKKVLRKVFCTSSTQVESRVGLRGYFWIMHITREYNIGCATNVKAQTSGLFEKYLVSKQASNTMLAQLCDNCRTTFDGNAPKLEAIGDPSDEYYIHRYFQSFANARQAKCRLCHDLWTRLGNGIGIAVEELSTSGLVITFKVRYMPGDDGKPRCIFWMFSFWLKESTAAPAVLNNQYMAKGNVQSSRFRLKSEIDMYQLIYSRVIVLTDSAFEDKRSLGGIGSSSSSLPSREMVNDWVRSCVDNHPECKPWRDIRRDPASPARLLDVRLHTDTMVYLHAIEKDAMFDEVYITLSYCTESTEHLVLTKGTIKELESGIRPQKLPRLFRNAIAVTRQLGVRYLWIKSLCILQDSEDDQRIEREKIGDIYENALVNIFAASAHDSDGGLFFDREELIVQPLQVKIPWPLYQSYTASSQPSLALNAKIYDCNGLGDWKDIMESGPLNRRACSLQERFISRRIIRCYKDQLYWECRRGRGNESYPAGLGTGAVGDCTRDAVKILDRISREGSWRMTETGEFKFHPPTDKKLLKDAYTQWAKLIEIYTELESKNHENKLLEFSAIADRFATLLSSEYICGLLTGDICNNLLWFTKDPSALRLSTGQNTDKCSIPSWSWASVKGKVEWCHDALASPRFQGEVLESNFLEYHRLDSLSKSPGLDDLRRMLAASRITNGQGTRPSTFYLRAKGFFLYMFVQWLTINVALEQGGPHTRMLWMRTSPARTHYGFVQFDDSEIIQQLSENQGNTDFSCIIGVPVSWRFEKTSGANGSEKRVLKVAGLVVTSAKDYGDATEYRRRIGRFEIRGITAAENDVDQRTNELLNYLERCHRDSLRDIVLL
ncbi:hypothetical protein N0V90_004011 [Kalmusia sp. IMI 367209]|nr:hypothetical protein N0V90_004011 [Kalmusia sp. IMI 367209]